MAETTTFDVGNCTLGAGFGNGLEFRADEAGTYRFSLVAPFPTSLGAYAAEAESCATAIGCAMTDGSDGTAGEGGTSGADALELEMSAGETVIILMNAERGDSAEDSATLYIDRP